MAVLASSLLVLLPLLAAAGAAGQLFMVIDASSLYVVRGQSWAKSPVPFLPRDVAFNPAINRWVAVGDGNLPPYALLAYSDDDGVSWTPATPPSSSSGYQQLNALSFDLRSGLFWFVNGRMEFSTSTNGANWSAYENVTQPGSALTCWSGTREWLVGSTTFLYASQDFGASWASWNPNEFFFAFAELPGGPEVAVSLSRLYVGNSTTWHETFEYSGQGMFRHVASSYRQGLFVAMYSSIQNTVDHSKESFSLFTSGDGLQWTQTFNFTGARGLGVVYDDVLGLWLATGSENSSVVSTDGKTWMPASSRFNSMPTLEVGQFWLFRVRARSPVRKCKEQLYCWHDYKGKCGVVSDGCGGTMSCAGNCRLGPNDRCDGSVCRCPRRTCAGYYAGNCSTKLDDGCGGFLDCSSNALTCSDAYPGLCGSVYDRGCGDGSTIDCSDACSTYGVNSTCNVSDSRCSSSVAQDSQGSPPGSGSSWWPYVVGAGVLVLLGAVVGGALWVRARRSRAALRERLVELGDSPDGGPFNVDITPLHHGARAASASVSLGTVLGAGSFGQVLSCKVDGAEYAVKLFTLGVGQRRSPAALAKVERSFRAEMELLSGLNHEHVVRYVGWFELPRAFGLVMEKMDASLEGVLAERRSGQMGGWFEEREVLLFGVQIARGLAYLHGRGVAHRDVKPGNVLAQLRGLRSVSRLVLTDFGVSRAFQSEADDAGLPVSAALAHTLAGTPGYLAPEVLSPPFNPFLADIYSFGAVLFNCATDVAPNTGAQAVSIDEALRGNDEAAARWAAWTDLTAIHAECCSLVPDERPTAAAVADRCAACVPDLSSRMDDADGTVNPVRTEFLPRASGDDAPAQ